MKKTTITLTLMLFCTVLAWAQKEYKVTKSTGKLHLEINGALIEGYDGNEIIFSVDKSEEEEVDERAKGLQAISGSMYKDNTGLGINVTEDGQDVRVNLVGKSVENGLLKIRVPKQFAIVFNFNKSLYLEPVTIKNMSGEIELAVSYNEVVLENNTGPMNVKTIYSGVDAKFGENIIGPISMISVYGHLDVALPVSTRANVELGTSYGKLYAADEFDLTITRTAPNDEDQDDNKSGVGSVTGYQSKGDGEKSVTIVSSASAVGRTADREQLKGTINGGGVDLILKSNYKNVYLRTR